MTRFTCLAVTLCEPPSFGPPFQGVSVERPPLTSVKLVEPFLTSRRRSSRRA